MGGGVLYQPSYYQLFKRSMPELVNYRMLTLPQHSNDTQMAATLKKIPNEMTSKNFLILYLQEFIPTSSVVSCLQDTRQAWCKRYTRWSYLRGQQTAFPHQIPPFVHQVIYQGYPEDQQSMYLTQENRPYERHATTKEGISIDCATTPVCPFKAMNAFASINTQLACNHHALMPASLIIITTFQTVLQASNSYQQEVKGRTSTRPLPY